MKETACGTPGYVAPEILRGDKYGAEVDIWSMGVICYVLLAGYPPFYDEDQKRLFKKIKEGRYHFHEDYWSEKSPEAIDMIRKMLCVDQSKRWTAEQLLGHPWIVLNDDSLLNKDLTESITVMKKFNARRRLRAAADAVIMANRMKNMFNSRKEQLQKKPSLLDLDAVNSADSTPLENSDGLSNPAIDWKDSYDEKDLQFLAEQALAVEQSNSKNDKKPETEVDTNSSSEVKQ